MFPATRWEKTLGEELELEKEMATRSSILAWRIPWTEEPMVHRVAKNRTRLKRLSTHAGKELEHQIFSLASVTDEL